MTNPMDEKKIIEKFKERKKKQLIISMVMIASMVYLIFQGENPDIAISGIPQEYLLYGVVTVIIIGAAFSFKNWRCPACGKYLGKGINPQFCPKCGVKLH